MAGEILLEADGDAALVTIANPDKLNAMTEQMWRDLNGIFTSLATQADLRCVLVRGQGGKAFSAGADISEFETTRSTFEKVVRFHEEAVGAALSAIFACPVPVVAEIAGACMGGGLEIAAMCDIRIAGAGARVGAPVARLGFPLAFGEMEAVYRLAGPAVVAELLLEGRVMGAGEAHAKGLLTRVVADDQVAGESMATVRRIAGMSPWATRSHKRQIRRLMTDPSPVTRAERMEVYAFADTEDYRIGISAFLDKRTPQFTGR